MSYLRKPEKRLIVAQKLPLNFPLRNTKQDYLDSIGEVPIIRFISITNRLTFGYIVMRVGTAKIFGHITKEHQAEIGKSKIYLQNAY